jgi:hypothetical protein
LNAGAKTDFKSPVNAGNAVHELAFNWQSAEARAIRNKAIVDYYEKASIPIPEWYKNLDAANMGSRRKQVQKFSPLALYRFQVKTCAMLLPLLYGNEHPILISRLAISSSTVPAGSANIPPLLACYRKAYV